MANSFLFGTPSRLEQRNLYSPEQESVLAGLLQAGQGNLRNPLAGFDSLKNRANQRFQQETVPGLLERFSGAGSMGLSSPSLKAELSQAGGTLQERLAGLESQYRAGREGLGMQQLGMGLTPLTEAYQLGEDPGLLKGLGGGLSQGLGMAAPYLLNQYFSGNNTGAQGDGSGANIASSLGSAGGTALAGLGGLGTVGTLGAGAAGAAGVYGLYKLLSYLLSNNQQQQPIAGQQQRRLAPANLMGSY